MNHGHIAAMPTMDERVEICRTHLLKSVEWKGSIVGIMEMRRHYTNYFKGFDHFKDFRLQLVTLSDLQAILDLLDYIKEHYQRLAA
jgi:tRNA-dihydrouridine synthase